jgi:hypothetical protein
MGLIYLIYMCVYVCVCIYTHTHTHTDPHIYVCVEREGERESGGNFGNYAGYLELLTNSVEQSP